MRKADFDRLVAQLQGLKAPEGSEEIADDTIVSTIQQHGQPVYQIAHDRGHSAGMGKKGTEVTTLTAQVTALTQERDDARAKLEELKGKAPDGEKLKAEYATELQKAQEAFTKKETALKAALKATRLAWAKADLRSSLVSDFKVDADYAAVIVEKPEVVERIQTPDDHASPVEVLQRGKQIPFAPGDGQTAIGLLAAELREGVPAKFITSDADSGAGATNGAGAGGTKGFDYAKHAEKHQKKNEAKAGEGDDYRKRMGIQTTT